MGFGCRFWVLAVGFRALRIGFQFRVFGQGFGIWVWVEGFGFEVEGCAVGCRVLCFGSRV